MKNRRWPRNARVPTFVDETYVNTKMTWLRGRGRKGQRLRASAPFGHWTTHTFLAGLRCHELSAPWIIDGPITRSVVDTCIETQLAPTLRKGDVEIFDNLAVRRGERAADTTLSFRQRAGLMTWRSRPWRFGCAARNARAGR
jgi:hypothetical protein